MIDAPEKLPVVLTGDFFSGFLMKILSVFLFSFCFNHAAYALSLPSRIPREVQAYLRLVHFADQLSKDPLYQELSAEELRLAKMSAPVDPRAFRRYEDLLADLRSIHQKALRRLRLQFAQSFESHVLLKHAGEDGIPSVTFDVESVLSPVLDFGTNEFRFHGIEDGNLDAVDAVMPYSAQLDEFIKTHAVSAYRQVTNLILTSEILRNLKDIEQEIIDYVASQIKDSKPIRPFPDISRAMHRLALYYGFLERHYSTTFALLKLALAKTFPSEILATVGAPDQAGVFFRPSGLLHQALDFTPLNFLIKGHGERPNQLNRYKSFIDRRQDFLVHYPASSNDCRLLF